MKLKLNKTIVEEFEVSIGDTPLYVSYAGGRLLYKFMPFKDTILALRVSLSGVGQFYNGRNKPRFEFGLREIYDHEVSMINDAIAGINNTKLITKDEFDAAVDEALMAVNDSNSYVYKGLPPEEHGTIVLDL